jgi:membrane protease YdiL (CAAX protease family)
MSTTTETQQNDQYSLAKILGIWAAVAVPMPILVYVIAPELSLRMDMNPAIAVWLMIILGMVWQFVVSLIVLYRELGTLRWSVIRKRMWYQTPRDPNTGAPNARLLWWALPGLALNGLVTLTPVTPFLSNIVVAVFPFLRPLYNELSQLALDVVMTPEYVGAWWLLGLVLISSLFNYFLGEEWLFRGVLLPKMKGVFGRWDWVANVALFGLYHLNKPWESLGIFISFLIAGWASRRYRSNWIFFIVHGVQGLIIILMTLAVVTGLAFR